jgi:hypothetical protein
MMTNRMRSSSRRCSMARYVPGVGVVAVLVAFSLLTGGTETSVPDEAIRDIISMPEGTPSAMREFVQIADSPDMDVDVRNEMLANPHVWFEENYGIILDDAVLWTVDFSVAPPEDERPWLYESEYLGDDPLMKEAVVFSGPNLCLFIQISEDAGASGGGSDAVTQRFLEVISGRSEEEWNNLRSIVLDVNRANDEEQTLFKEQTRQALINYNQRLSGANSRLLVVDLALGNEYGAVRFGEIPTGMVMTPQALTVIGESVAIVYNSLF